MESTTDTGCILLLSLAVKCGGGGLPDAHRLVPLAVASLFVFVCVSLVRWSSPGGPAWGKYKRCSIPGPRGLPVVGSMALMTGLAHRKLAAAATSMSATRLMAFSLGGTRVVITSDPDVAREILSSSAFADRPIKESAYGLMFHRAIGFAPYGVYWRFLRRISAAHLFSPKQIAASETHRSVIAAQMVNVLGALQAENNHGVVRARDVVKRASLHNVMWSVFGRRYELSGVTDNSSVTEVRELRELVEEGYDLLGTLNWSDHLQFMAPCDPQGIRLRCSRLVPRVDRFVSNIIDEHRRREQPPASRPSVDFVDVLLSMQGGERLSDSDMVAVLWEMIFRGTDTVAVLIEWALARLGIHQEVQARAHEELDRVVGRSRVVTESDTETLAYLQAVIKEVLRLHPPGPLLSWARLATSDVHVDGRLVPAGTTAMVNMWAIARDPRVWEDPLEFRPERFLNSGSEFSVFGSDLRLAPFGSGRRSCPGKGLAMATVSFWVATLLHEYTWAPAPAVEVDLSEVLRLSCEMAEPLVVKLTPRRPRSRIESTI